MTEPDRLLDDLARSTNIDTVVLNCGHAPSNQPEALVLPSARAFDGLPVKVVTAAELDSMFRFLDLARSKGFKVSGTVTPLNPTVRDRLPVTCVDVTGEQGVDTVVRGCPNNPAVVQYAETVVREMVSTWPAMDMLNLDHLEYTHWCQKGLNEFFVCFCGSCRQKVEGEGLDFERMRREVASAYEDLVAAGHSGSTHPSKLSANEALSYLAERPELAVWLKFRTSSMSDFIRRVVEAGRDAAREQKPDLQIGIGFQLPSIAKFVGTDINEVYTLFDWIAPKFPDYIPAEVVPRIAEELASRSGRWNAAELRPVIRELMDLGPGPEEYIPIAADLVEERGLRYSNVFDTSIIDGQMKHLEALIGRVPMYPWIWLHHRDLDDLRQKVTALDAHGFEGYRLWCWEQDLTTERLTAAGGVL